MTPTDRQLARRAAKRSQVEADISALERNQRCRAVADQGLEVQIAFQRQRLAWLIWTETASLVELLDRRATLEGRLGPDGLAALQDGIASGLPVEMLADMAELAIVTFALRM